jgi:hypothetical protein
MMLAPKIRANRIVTRAYVDNFNDGKPPFDGTSYKINALNNLSVNVDSV